MRRLGRFKLIVLTSPPKSTHQPVNQIQYHKEDIAFGYLKMANLKRAQV